MKLRPNSIPINLADGGKFFLLVLLGLLILAAIFWIMRKKGINMRLDNGINPSLVDNESVDDLSLNPSQNVN